MKRPLFVAGLTAFTALVLCMALEQLWIMILSAVIFTADLIFCASREKRRLKNALTVTAAWVAAALLFFAHAYLRAMPSFALCGHTVSVEGRLEEMPEQLENCLCARLKHCRINGKETGLTVTVYFKESALPQLSLYDTVRFPAVELNDAPEKNVFFFHGLSNDAWLSGWANTGTAAAHYTGHSPLYFIAKLRENAHTRLNASLSLSQAQIAAALLLGKSGELPPLFKNRLRTAGASHIFAVSGMHLALWSAVLFFLFQKRAKTKRWANAAAGAFVLFYMALTGFSPSVLRAGVMLLAVFGGRMLRLRADALNSLGLAALLLLAANPFLAGNVSFLLSFFATAAIVVFSPVLGVRVSGKSSPSALLQRQGAAVVNGVAVSLGVLFFTVPLSGLFFGGVSLLSPVSSVVCVLPAEGVMLTGAAGLLLSAFPSAAWLCFRVCGFFADLLPRAAERLARADALYVGVRETYILLWYVFTAALAYFIYRLTNKNRQAAVNLLVVSASFILILGGVLRLTQQNKTRLYLPDAGNATVVCLRFGDSGSFLIGTGEEYQRTRAALDALADRGVLQTDGLIVPDDAPGESGQLEYIAKNYAPETVFTAAGAQKLFPSAAVFRRASCFRLGLPNGWCYTNLYANGLRAGLLEGDSTVVFSFSPSNDFSAADLSLRSGACLVCRGGLPRGLDPSAFEVIFVLTDKSGEALSLPANAHSVHDLGCADLLL